MRAGRAKQTGGILTVNGVSHQPTRPSWDCAACGDQWPCQPLRTHLVRVYALDRPGLAQLMSGHYHTSLLDLPDVPAIDLHARIVGWVRPKAGESVVTTTPQRWPKADPARPPKRRR